jgi:hypothetical protein
MADTPENNHDGYTRGGKIVPEWWIREINKGRSFRKTYAQEERWDDWRRWYRGQWRRGILPSNIYFKMLRTLVPRVYYRNPSVSITPKKPGFDQLLLAKLLERADNTLIDLMGVKKQMKRAVLWSTMFGTSGLRLGYGAEFTPTPDAFETSDPDTGSKRMKRRVEYNSLIHANTPWCLAAHPGNIILPALTMDWDSARWICFESTRPLHDIMDDPRFDNTKELQDGLMGAGGAHQGQLIARSSGQWDRMRQGVVLWEIRDKKSGGVFVMAPYANGAPDKKILFQEDDDLQINGGLPFYPIIFNEDDEVFWGIPDSQILEPQQMEKNEIRTQMMYHRRAALRKLLYETGAISPDEVAKLTADDNVDIAIQVKQIDKIRELPLAGMPETLMEMEGLVDQEVEQLLGLGVNQFGEYAPGSADRSATEANIVNSATSIRIDERRDTCADVLVGFTSDMNHVIAQRWDQDMILRIAGPGGVPIWVQFQPQLLQDMDYEIKVDPDTSLPLTKQLRDQKATQVFQLGAADPIISGNPQSAIMLRKFWLNELYGVDVDFLLPDLQQPGANAQNPMPFGQAVQTMQQGAQKGPQPPSGPPLAAVGGRR